MSLSHGRSPVPLYYQLKKLLTEMIENEELVPGDAIPSERELSERYNISRMTVRQAITELVHEGVLYRQQGRGTFVSEPKIEQALVRLTSFTEDMRQRGLVPSTQVLEVALREASRRLAKQLELGMDHRVLVIKRLRLADDAPMALETCHFPYAACRELANEDLTGSLYELLETKYGYYLHMARQSLEPVLANADEARILQVDQGAPLLLMERITYLRTGEPIEFVRSVYRGDRYKFFVELTRQRTKPVAGTAS